jgi:hypothetical protein
MPVGNLGGHSLHPLASCACCDLRNDMLFSIRSHISPRDQIGHAALPANDHASDQSARVVVPFFVETLKPFVVGRLYN